MISNEETVKVKELRSLTGFWLSECRNALIATDWNVTQAKEWLRVKYQGTLSINRIS